MSKHGLAAGRYNKGSKLITLASGHEIQAHELIMMKKQKMSNDEIITYIESRSSEVPIVEVIVPKTPVVKTVHIDTWASVAQEEIINALGSKEVKPWYKKLFRKEEK